jgi:hypothetical protein
MTNLQTIAVWPDGTWCYSELIEICYSWKSNDYDLITFDENIYDPDEFLELQESRY